MHDVGDLAKVNDGLCGGSEFSSYRSELPTPLIENVELGNPG
jgi:hypothetical protein